MIKVLIVEDDLMVAEFNKRYLEKVEGFELAGVAHSAAEAREYLQTAEADLMLLDIYMPGENGLALLNDIRQSKKELDVILITAAAELVNIQTALRHGAADYLIKPFTFERFKQALVNYRETYDVLNKKSGRMNQVDLDQILFKPEAGKEEVLTLPKGVTPATLQTIMDTIRQMNETFSTEELTNRTTVSRVSVRKYLKFLTDIGVLEETLNYGIGRPVYQYRLIENNVHKINKCR